MKKYKYIAAGLLTSALLITGCSDSFLEVESPTQDFIDTYFTTDAHIQEAVVAAYDPLHWPDWAMGQYNPVNIMSDIMADGIWVGGADKTDNQYWHLMMNYEAQPTNCMTGLWTVAYSGVKRCNDVIKYLEWAGDNVTETNRNKYTAQVRVLRVFYYNWLWKFWGNIPYYETNLSAPYLAEQVQADQVYQNIITDLEGAIELDALPMKETSSNYGRVTKAMAYMLYAEIVMYQKDEARYGKALQYMQEIIGSDYSLVDDYTGIFKEAGEWSSESIFEINYKDDNAARSWNSPLYAGGTVLPRLIGPNGWTGGVDGHDNGWGFCPLRLETYELYADNDDRRGATCWNAAAAGSYNARYQDTGFFLEKYTAHTGDNADQVADGDLNYNNNLRIYRFAETLLNAAELIVRGAGTGDAKEYLNRVHSRAGLTDEIEATVDNIIEERRLEFVGEGKRYWDLVRTDKASSVLVPDQYGYRTNAWSASKKYLPIPQSEIDAAQGTLVQNNY
ncbi:MAG: RagB/SusD family nutrient uptake outer membrane protein [Breznakibacter sp.]